MKIHGTAKGAALSKKDFGVAFGKAVVPLIVATGGTISTDGDYKIHKFTSSGDFEVTQIGDSPNDEVEYLVVASGGGGSSGGGGAGGYLSVTDYEVTVQTYAVVIRSGGTAGTVDASAGGDGGDSTITPDSGSVITADGGGGGGGVSGQAGGKDGGSGGGGSWVGAGGDSGGSPTAGQGYAGGGGRLSTPHGAGGGGGASAVGKPAPSSGDEPRADGGDGLENDITGTALYYAGGGGSDEGDAPVGRGWQADPADASGA